MMMFLIIICTLFIRSVTVGSTSSLEDLLKNLPPKLIMEREWHVSPSEPIGSVVIKVQREKKGNENVTFGLETDGPPVPFKIDPHTGVVSVNDTLADKENSTYSLWVTLEGSSTIFQRIGVYAIITDNINFKPKVPLPVPFPSTLSPNLPSFLNTKYDTKVTTEETTPVPDPTTISVQKPPEVPEVDPESPETNKVTSEDSKNVTVADQKDTNISLTNILAIAVGGTVLIAVAVFVFVWKKNSGKKWSKEKKDEKNKDSTGIVLQDASLNLWDRPRAYSNRYESWDSNHLQVSQETSITKEDTQDEWEFPRHRLRMFNIVGEGAFGQVYRAQAIDIDGKKGETTVAVKTLKENAAQEEKNDLLLELNLMKCLETHPNVVRLIGCCTEKEPILLIMEFVSLGKLQQFLRDSRAERHYGNTHADSSFLTSSDLTHFAYQIARGMDFLSSKGIIHRDLAARNVLITEDRICKVADFGFARDVADTNVYERKSGGRLPIRWMAPESLYDNLFSVKSDIWSFGVLLWEIVTLGSTPYPGLSAGDVMQKVRDGHRLEKPEHCRREFYNIMYYCWEAEPGSRPDFKEVVAMLERLLCTETDYIELERFPDHSYYNVQHMDGEKL